MSLCNKDMRTNEREVVNKRRYCDYLYSIMGVLLCVLMTLGLNGEALAVSDGTKLVRVGYFEDNDGFQSGFNDNTPKSGYAYEYYQELAKYTGWTYKYEYGSWSEIYNKLVNGQIDIMGGVSKLDDRLPYMLFPENIMGVESYYIFVPIDEKQIKAGDVRSLNGKKIGVNDKTYMLALLKKFVAEKQVNCQVIAYPGTTERMQALAAKEIDGVVTVDNYTINDLKPTFKIGSSNYYFAVNKNRPDILKDLNEGQNKILSVSPYYITTLQKKYFDTSIIREALTDEERVWLSDHKELRLGYLKNCLPYCGVASETGNVAGLLAYILPDLQRFMGITINTIGYETAEVMNKALEAGEVDLIFPAYGDLWHAEKENYIQTTTVARDRTAVVYKAGNQSTLYKKIALSSQGVIQPFYISTRYPEARLVKYPDLEAGLRAVTGGDVSSLLISSNILYRYFAEHGQPADVRMAYLDDTINYSFAVHRGNILLYSIFNKAIASVDAAKISNVIVQNVNVQTKYSIKNFLEHYAAEVLFFLSCLLVLVIVIFVNYRHKATDNQKRLQEAYTLASKAARAKTEFLSNMSHDMRTPMNAIINLTNLAREDAQDKIRLKDDLDKIDTANKFLLGLINDILDMSKIESGHIELHPSVYNVEMLQHYLDSVIQPLCDDKNITLRWQKHSEQTFICVDEVRFNQIFFNLLSNAVKYSAPGSVVTLREENGLVDQQGYHVDFVFEDKGMGMSPEFQKKLFTPFERENVGDSRMGTGLGLAITKRIIDEMHGSIRVVSAPGKGTTIIVHLDLAIPSEEQIRSAILQESRLDEDYKNFDFTRYHILVAEDHPMNKVILLRLLEKQGLHVTVAEDGQKCLDLFAKSKPGFYNAILMDVRMPVMNGLEATKKIRALQRPDAATIPIIAMTAEAFDENKKATIAAGMDEHLSKPINPDQLFKTLRLFLEYRQN